MNNILDKNKLDELFNINDSEIIDVDVEEEFEEESHEKESSDIENELLSTMKIAKSLLHNAKLSIDDAPNPESMSAAAAIINSITGIIKEINKSLIIEKQFKNTKELENLRDRHRKELTRLKSKLNPIGNLAPGSSLYLQQNNYNGQGDTSQRPNENLTFSQESIVKRLIDEQKRS